MYSNNSLLEKTLHLIVLGGIFVLPFIVLIVSTSLFFPYITGKNFAFRIIVEIMAGAWIALAFMSAAYRPRVTAILVAFGAFIAAIALSDALGAYPFKSFWSNYERMEGWVTLAHLFAYFIVTASVMTPALWKRLFQLSLGVSAFVALYGFLQLFGVLALGWGGGGGLAARLDATLGNATYLAGYMLFHIGIAALLWNQTWREIGRGRSSLSIMYGSVIALDGIVLLFTGTRGAILGLIGGAILFLFFVACSRDVSRFARRLATTVLLGLVILAGVFFMVRDQSWVRSIGFLDRLATISLEDNTTKARFMNWGMALEGFKERPIVGWGQESYAYVFDKYYNPGMYEQEQWFDRVHNAVLDWLVAGGIVGLLLYLSLFITALVLLWRVRSESGEMEFSVIERSILTGLLAAYFFHNLFVFDNITSYILFVTILAYIAYRAAEARGTERLFGAAEARMPMSAIVAAFAVLGVWCVAWGVNAHGLAQNKALLAAITPQQNLDVNLGRFKEAAAYGSFGTQEVREQFTQAASQLSGVSQVPTDFKEQFFAEAAKEMDKQIEEMPLSARPPLFLGVVYGAYGRYEEGLAYLGRARDISPTKQTILIQLALNAFARDASEEGLAYLKKAHELAPEFREPRLIYATALIEERRDAEAEALLEPLIETGQAADARIAGAYVRRDRYDMVAALWDKVIAARPGSSIETYFSLAAAHYVTGNRARAIEVLQSAKSAHGSQAGQIDSFIEQMRAGTLQVE